jgi:hypothetical protein
MLVSTDERFAQYGVELLALLIHRAAGAVDGSPRSGEALPGADRGREHVLRRR